MHRLTESIIDHAAITLIIAHPDDECMFFYPTISRTKRLHIICLSNGGYDGLGEEREKELQRAARRLGASATCVNNAALQDGPHAWNPSVVAANVGPWLHAGAVVVTFDRYGASGHANHVAVYHGAAPASFARSRRRRDARRTQASGGSPRREGTAGSTRSRRRLIIDGTSARSTWRAPPSARVSIRARAGSVSFKLRVDGVQGAERVRDTVAAGKTRYACRRGLVRVDSVQGAERLRPKVAEGKREKRIGPCSSRASTCAAATRRSRRTRRSWSGSGGSSSSSPRTRTRTGSS